MTTPAIESIIARLEAEVGPNRRLDLAIRAFALPHEEGRPQMPLNYTASIDHALTLAPEGHAYEVCSTRDRAENRATIWLGEVYEATAPTAPLAICIAACKARLAERLTRPTARPSIP